MNTETEQKQRIAIQGIAGCFHEVAARNWLRSRCGEVETVECETFPELFERVVSDPSLLGIVAIENTIAGSLLPNHELLRSSGLQVLGEEKLRISHVLCALPGETIESVSEVNSHPMALMQCEEFLRSHKHINVVEKTDTAGSARDIAQEQLHGRAAVCAALAAQLYGLDILAEGIETNKRNFTRFLIVGHPGQVEKYLPTNSIIDKASIEFTLPHTQGALAKILTILSFYDLNLSKIQSLPIVGREWEYRFYVDLTFGDYDRYRQAIDAVRPLISEFKILGEYKETANPHE